VKKRVIYYIKYTAVKW